MCNHQFLFHQVQLFFLHYIMIWQIERLLEQILLLIKLLFWIVIDHHGVYSCHAIFLRDFTILCLHTRLLKRFQNKVSASWIPHWWSWDRSTFLFISTIHKCVITGTCQIGTFETMTAGECMEIISRRTI